MGYYRLAVIADRSGVDIVRLPFTIRVLFENVLRRWGDDPATQAEALAFARWGASDSKGEFTFLPARVLLQDFTGVPAVVDLAAMRAATAHAGSRSAAHQPARTG